MTADLCFWVLVTYEVAESLLVVFCCRSLLYVIALLLNPFFLGCLSK